MLKIKQQNKENRSDYRLNQLIQKLSNTRHEIKSIANLQIIQLKKNAKDHNWETKELVGRLLVEKRG